MLRVCVCMYVCLCMCVCVRVCVRAVCTDVFCFVLFFKKKAADGFIEQGVILQVEIRVSTTFY